jgi:hypothetical protein
MKFLLADDSDNELNMMRLSGDGSSKILLLMVEGVFSVNF